MLIYKITNTTNGKVYIGKTTTDVERRWELHKRHALIENRRSRFCAAIRKYGTDSFEHSVVQDGILTNDELNRHEIFWIEFYQSVNIDIGYNTTRGGDGGFTADMRAAAAAARRANGISADHHAALMAGRKRAGYKPRSQETRELLSVSLKRYYKNNPDHLDKITRINQEKAKSGENHPMWGKKHNEETRANMGKWRVGKSYEELYGEEKAQLLRNSKRQLVGVANPNYKDVNTMLLYHLVMFPRLTRQQLCELLDCSSTTLTKRFKLLLGIDNMQIFRRVRADDELITFFREKLHNELH